MYQRAKEHGNAYCQCEDETVKEQGECDKCQAYDEENRSDPLAEIALTFEDDWVEKPNYHERDHADENSFSKHAILPCLLQNTMKTARVIGLCFPIGIHWPTMEARKGICKSHCPLTFWSSALIRMVCKVRNRL